MEKMTAIIPTLRKTKMLGFSNEMYTLVVTDKRSIFANLSSAMLKEQINEAKNKAKDDGKGFFGQWGAQLGASFNYSKKYEKMKPDEILKENEKNFEIKNEDIEKVKYKWYHDQEGGRSYYDVIFKTSSEKYKFKTESDPKSQLKKAYGDKFKTGLF